MDFTVRIADRIILIHSVHSSIYSTCKDYLVDTVEKPDIEIRTDEAMISTEIERIRKREGNAPGNKTAEGLLIHRLIAEKLLEYNTFLMHGAAISTDNEAYVFSGKSGTGKTTHVQKWIENIDNAFIVNGDKPLVKISDERAYVCGTPWAGKEHYGTNTIVPLKSIVFMERSNKNYMEQVQLKTVFSSLLQQTYQPEDANKMRKTLALLMKLKDHVSFYRFFFDNFQEDCFRTSYDELTKKKI